MRKVLTKKKLVAVAAAAALSFGVGGAVVFTEQAAAAPSDPNAETATFPVVKYGAKGDRVKTLQFLLRANGQSIDADGSFGPKTQQAVKSFQSRNGLQVDGVVGPKTWPRLLKVVKEGNRGDAVKAAQVALRTAGHNISVDGVFGPATRKATVAFQNAKSLDTDAVIGPATWGALLGAKAPTPTKPPTTGTKSPGPDTRYPKPKGKYPNGEVPANQLCQVPGSKSKDYRMSCRAIPDFTAMNNAYKKQFGVNLQVDHLDRLTTYRTVADQRVLYNKYLNGTGNLAAKPGTSNHGWGIALDINMRRNGAGSHQSNTYKWLNANGPTYGFDDTVPSEDWHWEYHR